MQKNTTAKIISNAKNTIPLAVAKTGTIETAGKQVTGTGTLFLSEVEIGDWVYDDTQDEIHRVKDILTDTSLTLETAFSSDLSPGVALMITQSCVEIMVVFTPSAGKIDGVSFAPNLGFAWGKSGRDMSAQRDFVDPLCIDASGTVAYFGTLE